MPYRVKCMHGEWMWNKCQTLCIALCQLNFRAVGLLSELPEGLRSMWLWRFYGVWHVKTFWSCWLSNGEVHSLKSSCIQFHISLSNVFHAGKLVQFPQKLCYIVSLVLKTSNPMAADNTSQLSSQEHTNAIVEKFTRRFTQISSCQFDAIQFHRTFVMTLESETSEMQAFLTLDTENERVHFRSFRARQVAEIPLK